MCHIRHSRLNMEVFRSELNIFDPPEIQSAIHKGVYVDVFPLSQHLNTGIIEFEIHGGSEYIDLNDTMLCVNASVVNADGTAIATETEAAFINAPLYTMFSDVSVYFNDRKVSGGDQLYPYKSLITLLLSYSKGTLKQQIASCGFAMDDATRMDATTNTAHGTRKAWNNGRTYMGRLLSDVFQQQRYLLNGVTIRIKLHTASSEFALMCHTVTAKPKFIINGAYLSIRRVQVAPGVQLEHERSLNYSNAIYPYTQKMIHPLTITKGMQQVIKENLYNGALPKMLIISMVSSSAYVGSYVKNPFNFQHFNACLVSLKKDGEDVPFRAYEPVYDSKSYHREYMNIFTSFNLQGRDDNLSFSYDDFSGGYCFYVFNLTPDQSTTTSVAQQLAENSNVRFEIKFKESLAEDVTILIMGIFDGVVEIDAARNCTVSDI